MLEVDVPHNPNPFIVGFLAGPRCEALVFEATELYRDLYWVIVAKRTGELALSADISTGFEGDRWVGQLTVGNPIAYYGASHEFGTDDGDEHITAGAHDLNEILDLVAGL